LSERKLLSVHEVLNLPEPTWLIDRILPDESISTLWGPSNIGKSFVSLDVAASLAAGGHWLNQEITEPITVAYVAAEGIKSFKRRLDGWTRVRGVEPEHLEDRLWFTNWAVQVHEGIVPFMRLIEKIEPQLVVLDTYAACTLGMDEDSTMGQSAAIKNILKLRREAKTAVMLVHHSGWSSGDPNSPDPKHERGSSSLRGIVDLSIEVKGEQGWNNANHPKWGRTLKCHKQRDAVRFKDIDCYLNTHLWCDNGYVYETKVVTN
jgi:RecA-family ATPase